MDSQQNENQPQEKKLSVFARLILSKEHPNISQLADELDCTKQCVYRILDQINTSSFGTLIKEKNGKDVNYTLEVPDLKMANSSPDALRQLNLARAFLISVLAPKMKVAIQSELDDADAQIQPLGISQNITPSSSTDCNSNNVMNLRRGVLRNPALNNIVKTISDATKNRMVCIVSYMPEESHTAVDFMFAPLQLVQYQGVLISAGWVINYTENDVQKKYDACSFLYLHRIHKIDMTSLSSIDLPSIPTSSLNNFGIFNEKSFVAKIKFAPEVSNYVEERIWSDDQKFVRNQDGSSTLTMTCANSDDLISFVLGFRGKAILLEPEPVCEQLRNIINQMATSINNRS